MTDSETRPPVNAPRVVILHDPHIMPEQSAGDDVNQGSRAYAAGLRNLIRERFGHVGIVGLEHNKAFYYLEELQAAGDDPAPTLERFALRAEISARRTRMLDGIPVIRYICRTLSHTGGRRADAGRGDILTRMLKRCFFRRWDWLRRYQLIHDADLVISSGNGLFTDEFRGNMWLMLFDLYVAQMLGKTTIAVNQTIDIEDPFLRRLVRVVFERADYIAVREPLSVEHLEQIGIPRDRIVLAADCACINEAADDARIDGIFRDEGIPDGAVGLVVRGERSQNYDDWARLVRQIKSSFGCEVVFLSSCWWQDKQFGAELKSREDIVLPSRPFTFAELIGIYKRLRLLISDRYHANVFGLMAETPIVPITGNSSKIHGLLQFYDYPIGVCEVVDSINGDAVFAKVKYVIEHEHEVRRSISGGAARLRDEAAKNLPPEIVAKALDAATR